MAFVIEEDGQFRGTVRFLDARLQAGAISDDEVDAGADIAASKLEHQHRQVCAQESGTTASGETKVVHVVHGTNGTLKAFKAGCVSPCTGDATITVDLLKNGSSVLQSAITLDNSQSAYELESAVISSTSVAADDVLEVEVAVNAGTGSLGKGVFAYLDLYEDAV